MVYVFFIILIALLVGRQEDKGVMRYVPHMSKTPKYEDLHSVDVLGPDFGG